jgi:hypothetical protein
MVLWCIDAFASDSVHVRSLVTTITDLIRCTVPTPTPHFPAVVQTPVPAASEARTRSSTSGLFRLPQNLPLRYSPCQPALVLSLIF